MGVLFVDSIAVAQEDTVGKGGNVGRVDAELGFVAEEVCCCCCCWGVAMRTLIVSVLSLRLVPFLRELEREVVDVVVLVICRRRECMLRCFFNARTGLIWKDRVPRFICEGIGDWVDIGERAWFTKGEWERKCFFGGRFSTFGAWMWYGGEELRNSVRWPMVMSTVGSEIERP